MFLIKIKNTIHGKCLLYSSIQGGQTTRFFTRFLYSEKSREKSSRLAEALQKRITAFEMKCYRKFLQIPYTTHRTNESVKEELTQKAGKAEMLVSIIKKRQLKWLGHVTRHKDSLPLTNNIMHGRAPGKRGGADQG